MNGLTDYKEENLISKEDKIKNWGIGEWVDEPDKITFIHEGIKCEIIRPMEREMNGHLFGGHLCGYCYVPHDHKDFKKETLDYDCYKGITYDKKIDILERVVGFDCAHSGDVVPSMKYLRETIPELRKIREEHENIMQEYTELYPNCDIFKPSYKNINFVIEECKRLAKQIKIANL